ncbi:MAG: lysophospholipid acyltransferase family protein [Pseudomonadota bacterium]
MSLTWNAAEPPEVRAPRAWERGMMILRGLALVLLTYFGMIFVLLFNLIERALPLGISHRIICLWGRICLRLCGLRLVRQGTPMQGGGAIVANHASWIDIFTLLAADQVYFVSKADVARWPVVGVLSRQIGTVYIERKRTEAKQQEAQLRARLEAGDKLCFFPEGTSTDGQRVLDFRSTLFAAFMAEGLRDTLSVQPVSVIYHPPEGLPPAFYGWWGAMGLGSHLSAVFALSRGGIVEVVHHAPLAASDYPDRKALAAACEAAVRCGVETALLRGGPPAV